MAGQAKIGPRPSTELDDVVPRALFGGLTDESWIWLNLEGRDRCPFLGRYLPSLPGTALEGRVTAQTGQAALETASRLYILIKRAVREVRRRDAPLVPHP